MDKDCVLEFSDDDEFGVGNDYEEGLSLSSSSKGVPITKTQNSRRIQSLPGGAFSALNVSICPVDAQQLVAIADAEYRWDEFGFRVDIEDGPEYESNKILTSQFIDDPQNRLKWIAYLEFGHDVEHLTWDKIELSMLKNEKLRQMIYTDGVAHSLRFRIWPRLCSASFKQAQSTTNYAQLVKESKNMANRRAVTKQIEKDLLRTLPNNACFFDAHSPGIPKLRRVLRSVAYMYPQIGYCQGMGVVAATLLLFMEEEDTFWVMVSLIEDILPPAYYTENLLGLQADQRVLRQLVTSYLPDVDRALREHDIELSLITLQWFLTLFAGSLHPRLLIRVWDLLFFDGTSALFQVTLAMLKLKEADIRSVADSGGDSAGANMFNLLAKLPQSCDDVYILFDVLNRVASGVSDDLIESLRQKHTRAVMAEQGESNEEPLMTPARRRRLNLTRSKSMIGDIFSFHREKSRSSSPSAISVRETDPKLKNVLQTELIIELKDSIGRVAKHFCSVDPSRYKQITLQADYSADSHTQDHAHFLSGRREGLKRARALLDFERQDDDELGFRKNDIITIVSEKDEHCWVGELNGLRGWFPAKFVQVLDERGKEYDAFGDSDVTDNVNDLIRGVLAPAVSNILYHGMRRAVVLGSYWHPWTYIEQVATNEVQRDFRSVQSRLVLCKTFNLDQDGKVLTPEELLYRTVVRINVSHNTAKVSNDVKLRSLICAGLNEQALHLWFELLCCCTGQDNLRGKWYHSWSFVRSPAWVQIKCELRLLAQFSFNLNIDSELPRTYQIAMGKNTSKAHKTLTKSLSGGLSAILGRSNQSSALGKYVASDVLESMNTQRPLRDGVRDMLVKHHLFSWDL